MSKENGKIYLNSGARPFTLPSGDEGLYVDLCIEDLKQILEDYEAEEIQRPWVNRKENKAFNNIRIFAIPKRDTEKETLYPYYLEIARVKKD